MKKKILILYSTKNGATKDSAILISKLLQEEYSLVSDVLDANNFNKKNDLSRYILIVIGTGIRMGRWYGKASKLLKFFDKNPDKNHSFAIFVSSGRAGHAFIEKNQEDYNNYFEKYIEQKLLKFPNIKPILAKKAFGGWKIKNGEKWNNTWNKKNIQEWAREIGNYLKE